MKKILLVSAFTLQFAFSFAQSGEWYVQVAVYDKQVPGFYFADLDNAVFYSRDNYDFHRYYIGAFDKTTASQKMEAVKSKGFNASLMHTDAFGIKCCNAIPAPEEITASLRSLFFDFDKYILRPESKSRLDILVENLKNNPTYSVKIMAHTDAKGSDSYNETLSRNRANAARQYLRKRGIAASRIKSETFGESHPIAKNQLSDGTDTEEGRQFNRRVELVVLDADGHALNVVADINVPNSLAVK